MKRVVVTISGEPNAGSTTAAKLLAKKAGLDYFSPGRLFKDISKGVWKNQYYAPIFQKICAESKLAIPDFDSNNDTQAVVSLWDTDFGKSPALHKAIDALQAELSQKGNIVLDGKLSLMMIDNASLKVWLHATPEAKWGRAMERDSISLEEARTLLPQRELREREEWKKIYGLDYFDQRDEADLVIDSTTIDPSQIADTILRELNKNL